MTLFQIRPRGLNLLLTLHVVRVGQVRAYLAPLVRIGDRREKSKHLDSSRCQAQMIRSLGAALCGLASRRLLIQQEILGLTFMVGETHLHGVELTAGRVLLTLYSTESEVTLTSKVRPSKNAATCRTLNVRSTMVRS